MFDEKKEEYSSKQGKNIPVYQHSKYVKAREKAVELINKKDYGLSEADFWILMNETKSGKMQYSGLYISHNGCLKINDNLEENKKFNPECVLIDKEGYNNTLVYTYINKKQGLYEVGEISKSNCKNSYPYAMALKRCFDRVVLKNSRLAYESIYSDSEGADIEKEQNEENEKNNVIDETKANAIKKAIKNYKIPDAIVSIVLAGFNYAKIEDIKIKDYKSICDALADKK